MVDLKSAFNSFKNKITAYESEEAHELSFYVFRHFYGISKNDLITSKSIELFEKHKEILEAINNNEPIQYILGEAYFYDLKFKVNKHVLIPRPETEELVKMVLDLNPKYVFDIGTGSGCIPIAIAKNSKNLELVAGIDISEDAIVIAKENAELNNVNVFLTQMDLFNFNYSQYGLFDIVVSNPPYVKHSEKKYMKANVTDHEPHLALFVPDNDPLIYYKEIAELAPDILINKGKVIVEINSALGIETADIFKKKKYKEVEIIKDMFGKDRFVFAKL